jgi:hypothetical protein
MTLGPTPRPRMDASCNLFKGSPFKLSQVQHDRIPSMASVNTFGIRTRLKAPGPTSPVTGSPAGPADPSPTYTRGSSGARGTPAVSTDLPRVVAR